jgi:hypothetical protein
VRGQGWLCCAGRGPWSGASACSGRPGVSAALAVDLSPPKHHLPRPRPLPEPPTPPQPPALPQAELARLPDYNFDHPDAFDTQLMLEVVQVGRAAEGRSHGVDGAVLEPHATWGRVRAAACAPPAAPRNPAAELPPNTLSNRRQDLRAGRAAEMPQYDFASHRRVASTRKVGGEARAGLGGGPGTRPRLTAASRRRARRASAAAAPRDAVRRSGAADRPRARPARQHPWPLAPPPPHRHPKPDPSWSPPT